MGKVVLFLFLTSGSGAHVDTEATTAQFKTVAACEQALVTAIESQPEGVGAYGFCTPTKVR